MMRKVSLCLVSCDVMATSPRSLASRDSNGSQLLLTTWAPDTVTRVGAMGRMGNHPVCSHQHRNKYEKLFRAKTDIRGAKVLQTTPGLG